MSGCARGHQPRKRGCGVDVGGAVAARGASSIAPSIPCVRGSGPIAAISSSLMPATRKRRKPPLAVGDAERRVARAGELARLVDEPLEHLVDRRLRRDGEHRVADRLQRCVRGRAHRPPNSSAARPRLRVVGSARGGSCGSVEDRPDRAGPVRVGSRVRRHLSGADRRRDVRRDEPVRSAVHRRRQARRGSGGGVPGGWGCRTPIARCRSATRSPAGSRPPIAAPGCTAPPRSSTGSGAACRSGGRSGSARTTRSTA